ncbi:hypothetical protein [Streptomyces himalayensis]|uniref:Tape measure protein n=1 Tax=Streptomyces himalayensis subsp. himalayensis TaxID=2756131 RepID=A0A7W0DUP2_9ACTN|nr:hypothetical protein [Streptomyces himalayensis]MBA2951584.1 hypothetical protein [Streptomyces himalayensis subsp. himalayensis]
MAQHLTFVLDGRDNLSPALNHAGNSAAQLQQRLAGVTRDANGRLRDLRGRFLSAADAAQVMAGGMPVLANRLGDVASAGGNAAGALGGSGGGLTPALLAVAGAAGLSVLPALGALVPMMAGVGVAAGTLKLGFKGVGEALEQAGKDKKKYQEALKKLGPEQREFTKALVDAKKQFEPIGREIQKAMLPAFTKTVKAAGPVVKILGDSMTDMAEGFGKAADGVTRLLKDSGFQRDFTDVLRLGNTFVKDMAGGVGRLGVALFDFGAKSEPTLKALSGGLSDLLGKGLPGMFKGLETGIDGSAKFLDGFFGMVNQLLPAIGRLSGAVARELGPLLGQTFKMFGTTGAGAMDAFRSALVLLRPVFRDIGFGLTTIRDVAALVGPTLKDTALGIIGAFAPVGTEVDKAAGPLQRLNGWVKENKIGIMEAARVFGGAVIDMVDAAVQSTPSIIRAFRLVAIGVLGSLDGIVSGAATAFSWVPGIGPKLKKANTEFDRFRGRFLDSLDSAERGSRDFAASVGPRLAAGKLKLDINNWNAQIAEAKRQMKSVPPSKRADLKAHIADLQAKVRRAKADLASVRSRTVTLTTRYVVVGGQARQSGAQGSQLKYASGGLVRTPGFPGGGLVEGPGSGTSDSILARVSNGEFVVRARSVARYGVAFLKAINEGRLGLAAATGGSGGAGGDVARGLALGMEGASGSVLSAARRMAAAVTTGVRAELQIASPSKKMQALAKDVGAGFIKGLPGSRDKIKATAADLAKDIWAAFSGSKDNRLVAMVNKQTKKLMDLASKRDSIGAKIKAAKEFAETTRVGAKKSASLGSMFGGEEEVTAAGIQQKLAQKLTKMKTFTSYIKTLAKRGLNKTMLREILEMGPEEGYAYASALAGANSSIFKEINSTQYKINDQAERLGRTGADVLYDSGKNAGKGFLAGLQAEKKSIEKLMLDIAKGMQKAIKKALGIKSPSTVMARLGAYSTEGLARGLVQALPAVDQALDTVAGRVAATRPAIGRPAAVAASGQAPIIVNISGALDPEAVAMQIEKVLTRLKRNRGGAKLNFV